MPILIKRCLRVTCPKCGAKRGEFCNFVGEVKPDPPVCHDERIALSEQDTSQAAARIVKSE